MADFFLQYQSDFEIPLTFEIPWISNVVFTSRTHSQLKQAMKELNTTNYRGMKSAIWGSRNQLCIDSELQQQPEYINGMCKSKVKERKCEFFKTFEELKSDESFMNSEINGRVLDIEDLVTLGTEKKFCPYYMSQHISESADIVFSPYNYVLEEKIRCKSKTIRDVVHNGIIIFDEAHNVPQICEDSASIEFTSDDILTALADVDYVSELVSNKQTRFISLEIQQGVHLRYSRSLSFSC